MCFEEHLLEGRATFRYSRTMRAVNRDYAGLFVAVSMSFAFLFAASALWADASISIYPKQNDAGNYEFYADNKLLCPAWISIDFNRLNNLKSSVTLPFRTALPAQSKSVFLFALEQIDKQKSLSYNMAFTYAKGDPSSVRPDPDYLYVFPWAHGEKHEVEQGYNGPVTHSGQNQYALDFDLALNTAVHAARGGLVVEVKTDSNRGGPSAAYEKDQNFISIYHSDGTFGNYVHLRQGGSVVKPGDKVKEGDLIGYSGNTGVSSGPHLHFDVRVPRFDGKEFSIPTHFLNYDRKPVDPVMGEFYYSTHRDLPNFQVSFGRDISNETYAGYSVPTAKNNKVEIRTERHDRTDVLFLKNGSDIARDLVVDFKLRNYTTSLPFPIKITIPPLTERYLVFLRPAPGSMTAEYSLSLRDNTLTGKR
jgi:murein DD-endopeptidase MepM/ murein hydrolase activator NlpD